MTGFDHHWTFGDRCHIRFPNGGDPVLDFDHVLATGEGYATWSDSAGNLRFYTNGGTLYDIANAPINPVPQPQLGGTASSAHPAIVVPPAGGGVLYHIFAVGDWDGTGPPNVGPVTHSMVALSSTVTIVSPPTDLTAFGPQRAAEKLAAIPHKDCGKYWVVSFDGAVQTATNGLLHAILVDSDAPPTTAVTSPCPTSAGYCVKFSPDGALLAVTTLASIDIYNFDRATGLATLHSQITGFDATTRAYGVEFSPNGLYLYFTGIATGDVRRHTIGPSAAYSTSASINQWPATFVWSSTKYRAGALQLGPNGKIYGAKYGVKSLFEIGDPDNPAPAGTQFQAVASKAGGGDLALNRNCYLGLPTFTRISPDCADNCRNLGAMVNAHLAERALANRLITCAGEPVGEAGCSPAQLPDLGPWTSISWGSSRCDCIEGDDVEVMHLTVCNPYSNLTLANVIVHQLVVVDDLGRPVPPLPDGSPAITLTPMGPYCFDDIPPCTCVNREFVLRLRGIPGGRYRILVRGICFDASIHGDAEACFAFDVCKD